MVQVLAFSYNTPLEGFLLHKHYVITEYADGGVALPRERHSERQMS